MNCSRRYEYSKHNTNVYLSKGPRTKVYSICGGSPSGLLAANIGLAHTSLAPIAADLKRRFSNCGK
jgi:hypothetical protein